MSSDLAEFLRTQLDAREQKARGQIENGPEWLEEAARFDADPSQDLREVEAKRRIISEHEPDSELLPEPDGTPACGRCGDYGQVEWPCLTLRLLALPYDSHPNYREEWRP